MRKVFIYSTLGTVLVLSGTYAVSNAYAEDAMPRGNVSEEVRIEHFEEREAERAEIVVEAVEDGTLTQRQAEILHAMAELRPVGGRGLFGAGRDLSEEEREALREEMREQRDQSMLDQLNEAGLDVTEEELQELREVREELGLMGKQSRRGGQGGMGSGECVNN